MRLKYKDNIVKLSTTILHDPAILESIANDFKHLIIKRQQEIDPNYDWPEIKEEFEATITFYASDIILGFGSIEYEGDNDNINKHLKTIPDTAGVYNPIEHIVEYSDHTTVLCLCSISSKYTKEEEQLLRSIGVIRTEYNTYNSNYDTIGCEL